MCTGIPRINTVFILIGQPSATFFTPHDSAGYSHMTLAAWKFIHVTFFLLSQSSRLPFPLSTCFSFDSELVFFHPFALYANTEPSTSLRRLRLSLYLVTTKWPKL